MLAKCVLVDCLFYKETAGGRESGMCDCSHKEKGYHLNQHPCPLYRTDFSRVAGKLDALRERFSRGGGVPKIVR